MLGTTIPSWPGCDPAIHANTTIVAFAWMPASRAGMTVEEAGRASRFRGGRTVEEAGMMVRQAGMAGEAGGA
jgi:hypothetical protein